MSEINSVIFALLFGLLFSSSASAQSRCSEITVDVPVKKVEATAATLANLRGSTDSIKTSSKSLLEDAISQINSIVAPSGICPTNCQPSKIPKIIFSSVPLKRLTGYNDEPTCATLLAETTSSPLTFTDRSFDSLDSLNKYFSELGQGGGEDGKKLYQQCYASCSPQFESAISKGVSGFSVDSQVVCGHARDKDDGMYQLSVSYRWHCVDVL